MDEQCVRQQAENPGEAADKPAVPSDAPNEEPLLQSALAMSMDITDG